MTSFIPHQRPLLLFDGNNAHSTGYSWNNAAGIYVGGQLWEQGRLLQYSSFHSPGPRSCQLANPACPGFSHTLAWSGQQPAPHPCQQLRCGSLAAQQPLAGKVAGQPEGGGAGQQGQDQAQQQHQACSSSSSRCVRGAGPGPAIAPPGVTVWALM